MKYICFDQSTAATGYSVWSLYKNGRYKLLKHGTIKPKYKKTDNATDKMFMMCSEIEGLVKKEKPDFAVVEDIQKQTSVKVFKILAQLQGFIFAAFYRIKLPFVCVYPKTWKAYADIKGRKREEQKQETVKFVKEKFGLETVTEDEADAIAIGYWAVNCLEEKEK